MAQKILGYIQLIWTCSFCQTQNPGAIKSCTSCGAPQPADVKFEKVDQEQFDFIKDEALIRMAKAGPDKHCPYCGTRNLSTDTRCKQCGSDITVGAQVRATGEVLEKRQPEPVQPPSNAPKKMSLGCIIGLVVGAVIGIILLVILFSNLSKRDSINATVKSVNWRRSIEVLAYSTIEKEDWLSEIPSNADIGYCSSEYHYSSDTPVEGATEVCGEPYTVDTGTGVGKVVQDCEYQVYEDYCEYTVAGWNVVDTLTLSGYDLNPRWPSTSLASNEKYGNQSESFTIDFSSSEGNYSLTTSNSSLFLKAIPGSSWILEVNGFGSVVGASPD